MKKLKNTIYFRNTPRLLKASQIPKISLEGRNFFVSKYGFMVFKTTGLNPRKQQKKRNLKRMHEGWEKNKNAPIFGILVESADFYAFFHFSQAICHYFQFRFFGCFRGFSPVILNTINPYLETKKFRPNKEIFGIWEALSRRGVLQKYIVF